MANIANKSEVVMQTAIVARGRSIDVPLASGEKQQVGHATDGTGNLMPVYRARTRKYREFEEVELPANEVRSLRASGYLVDPDNLPPPVQDLRDMPNSGQRGPGRVA